MSFKIENNVNLPNVFIVGAPKCGTSSLVTYMSEHPSIFMSDPKEPNYFARHLFTAYQKEKIRRLNISYKTNLIDYLDLFKNSKGKTVIGEASTRYIRSKRALIEIKALNPNAKIIVMLRNPVDLVVSWHKQKLYENQETVKNFSKAWDLQFERMKGECLPERMWATDELFYGKIGGLASQVEILLDIFNRKQICFIFFDDFVKDTKKEYARVLNFLNVDFDRKEYFPVINARKNIRFHALYRLLCTRTYSYYRLKSILEKSLNIKLSGLTYCTNRLFISTNKEKQNTFNKKIKPKLVEYFKDEIRRLEILSNRDLSDWYM